VMSQLDEFGPSLGLHFVGGARAPCTAPGVAGPARLEANDDRHERCLVAAGVAITRGCPIECGVLPCPGRGARGARAAGGASIGAVLGVYAGARGGRTLGGDEAPPPGGAPLTLGGVAVRVPTAATPG